MNLCSFESRLQEINGEVNNLSDMLELQRNYNLYRVQDQLEVLLWLKTGHQSRDRRKNVVPAWFIPALRGLMRMFAVTDDGSPHNRKKYRERFDGAWRHTTR